MANDEYDLRREVLKLLLRKIADDTYPSATMMDMAEDLLGPDELPAYAEVLMDKIRNDVYPSIPMMRRLLTLG